MYTLRAIAVLAAGLWVGAAVAAPDVTGTWDIVEETPQGEMEGVLMIKDAGDGYSGTINVADQKSKLQNVMVKGSKVMFDRTVETPNGNLDLSYTGTVDGDKIEGTIDAGQFGEIPFSGTRK